jgi:sulfite reductase alpha subunit-like flavoprotein
VVWDRGESDEQHPEGYVFSALACVLMCLLCSRLDYTWSFAPRCTVSLNEKVLIKYHRIDGTFIPWSVDLRRRLLEEFPLADGQEAIPDDGQIEPKWILEFAEESASTTDGSSPHLDPGKASVEESVEPSSELIPIPNCLTATLESIRRITPESHYQDTRHLIFTIPGSNPYPPGATLTIYPKNFPVDVSTVLERMAWTEIADRPLRFVPTYPGADLKAYSPSPIPQPPSGHRLTLRTLLTSHLDIMAIPRRRLFNQFVHYTDNEMHLERLHEFTSPELIDELYDYTTRPRRSILEVLSDFDSVKLPWQKICSIIPIMRGRQFSIASGGPLKVPTTLSAPVTARSSLKDTRVDLLIAIVKYRTIIKRIRHGVATRYISSLQPGQQLSVTLQQGSLDVKQSEVNKPVVMIAPGTGVAPMRSLAWERKEWRQELGLSHIRTECGQDLLLFGCRKKGVDAYFYDEWEDLDVDIWVAFSREQVNRLVSYGPHYTY